MFIVPKWDIQATPDAPTRRWAVPIVTVRIGKGIKVADEVIITALRNLNEGIRELLVTEGIISDKKFVEVVVEHDSLGMDINVEPIKITIKIEDSKENSNRRSWWLSRMPGYIDAIMDRERLSLSEVPIFQIVFDIGGHHAGALYNRLSWKVETRWIDQALVRSVQ